MSVKQHIQLHYCYNNFCEARQCGAAATTGGGGGGGGGGVTLF